MKRQGKNAKAPRPGGRSARGSRPSRTQSVRDVMTPDPTALEPGDSVWDAAALMRAGGIGDVVVVEENRLCGIVTDRDIVVRVLADGGDPAAVTVGEICSRDLATISPEATVDDAVQVLRERAVRRLPVLDEDGAVVGIVTIGDLAVARDRTSALADVSAAPPNA